MSLRHPVCCCSTRRYVYVVAADLYKYIRCCSRPVYICCITLPHVCNDLSFYIYLYVSCSCVVAVDLCCCSRSVYIYMHTSYDSSMSTYVNVYVSLSYVVAVDLNIYIYVVAVDLYIYMLHNPIICTMIYLCIRTPELCCCSCSRLIYICTLLQ